MPEQPADPIHYEMKIPPEPKDAPLNQSREKDAGKSGEDKASEDEKAQENADAATGDNNPSGEGI